MAKIVIRHGKAQVIYPEKIIVKHVKQKEKKKKSKKQKSYNPKVSYTPLYDKFPPSKYGEEPEQEPKEPETCSYCNVKYSGDENICEHCGGRREKINGK